MMRTLWISLLSCYWLFTIIWDEKHFFNKEMQEEVLEFFNKEMRNKD